HIGMFRNCAVKPNRHELSGALATSEDSLASIEQLTAGARDLCRRVGGPVFATCGPEGIVYVDAEHEARVPGVRVDGPIDIVGAGDSTTAGIVSALCCGATPAQAAQLGCLVASITIQQLGVTGTASPAQVREQFRRV
ncbi:MAG TPA: PfkB family carbohydrate kinase, partial [Planctomycetaceae bacterium]|nr:PfkB family carbohydrate kinase [Planctomycetaceae bacterium]